MLNISKSYMVSFDITGTDESVMQVYNRGLRSMDHVKTIFGKEVEALYYRLTSDEQPVTIKDYGKAHCPLCDKDIHGLGKIKFCPNCGLALKWSEK